MQRLANRRPNPARRGIAAALLMLGAMPAGAADPPRQWIVQGDEAGSAVLYGTPESDDLVFSLRCDHATKMLSVYYNTGLADGRSPGPVEVVVNSQGGSVKLAGSGSLSDMDDTYSVESATILAPAVEKLLAEAATLTVVVEDRRSELPIDATARTGIDTLIRDCRP